METEHILDDSLDSVEVWLSYGVNTYHEVPGDRLNGSNVTWVEVEVGNLQPIQ